ncbi:hypothetical protein [Falsiroseomonas selenitidurans]|uniref:Uncharacterized protein n=1 Tax=Falsiroseomonas selenitidurans TaxID=2716335 RepID=A0ABX1EB40_9PROT|nr:hypothetical protein [Falsiroseomonas selenitidurans]NKC33027.1 hypothetical protein [Falsiroseomonas selenitidurans]
MVAWTEQDAALLSASWIGERILVAAFHGTDGLGVAPPGTPRVETDGLLSPAAEAIERLQPEAQRALFTALGRLGPDALDRLAALRADYAAPIVAARRDAAAPAMALGAGDAWRPMALAGAIVVLLTVATTEVRVAWDSAAGLVAAEIHKHPGVPAEVAAIVATVAGVFAGTQRGGTAPTAEPPDIPPAGTSPTAEPPVAKTPNGKSPAAKAQGAAGSAKALPAPSQNGPPPRTLPLDDAQALRAEVERLAERDGWLDPDRWKQGRLPRASHYPGAARFDDSALPSTLGLGLMRVQDSTHNAPRFRVAARLGTRKILLPRAISRLRATLHDQFGHAVSFRSATPAVALAGSLQSGSSIAAETGGVGAVALLLADPEGRNFFALSAGHVFLDRNRTALLGHDVHSPALPEDPRTRIGTVAHVSLFPTREDPAPTGGDLGLVKISDSGFLPTPDKRQLFDQRVFRRAFYPFNPETVSQELAVVKASAATPFAQATLTAIDVTIKYFYPMTRQMFAATGLQEITLADSDEKQPFRLAPGDSGALICVDHEGYTPLGLIVAGSVLAPTPPPGHISARIARDRVVGYVQTFHENIHLQGLGIH